MWKLTIRAHNRRGQEQLPFTPTVNSQEATSKILKFKVKSSTCNTKLKTQIFFKELPLTGKAAS